MKNHAINAKQMHLPFAHPRPAKKKGNTLIPALLLHGRRTQHAHTIAPALPLAYNLARPVEHLPCPATRHHDTTDDIDERDHEFPEASALLDNGQHNRLNIELDKDAWNIGLVDLVRLRGDGILVGFDSVRGVEDVGGWVILGGDDGLQEGHKRGIIGVDGGNNGKVVLELVKMVVRRRSHSNGRIERVGERGIVGSKRHLADDVGEVECCVRR